MKLNIEIELDWIDEDSTIDDVVKEQIIEGVVNKINDTTLDNIKKKVDQIIDKTIVDRITEHTDSLFDDFMSKRVQINDKYGDTIKSYENVTEVIKTEFDTFMTKTVDDKGRDYDGYGKKYTRLEFIINKQIKEFADKFTTDAVKKVSDEIKTHVQNGMTQKLGKELMAVLKVDKMLKIEK
jgi:hypothetical protein